MVRADMVLDVICVHSYIGYTRLVRAADRMRAHGTDVAITFRPYEIAPAASDSPQPLMPVLERMLGPYAATQAEIFTWQAARDGLELRYDRAIATGSFRAHLLIGRAAEQGLAEPVVERLFRAHFTDGLHIAGEAVLREIAEECGVELGPGGTGALAKGSDEAEELRGELHRLRRHGVPAPPVFKIGDDAVLLGVQSEQALHGAMVAAVRPAGRPVGRPAGRPVDAAF
ncbi:DsbA family protein [Streptomyces hiroshimensis]|uniref:Disulfide isomerase n=1 Tax=Streptomyces hiroshimensis TaxID=66424 RepID=A0ABQ2ZCY1_9ACTN|nr:DsbA family protein [Streptomyces hiroshimensis]GGY09791.1 disulfide isomerase [Streptomyces hiroshimensis]